MQKHALNTEHGRIEVVAMVNGYEMNQSFDKLGKAKALGFFFITIIKISGLP